MKRLNDQVAFRVLPKERRLLERAARKQGKSLSEWARITTVVEAEIQLGGRVARVGEIDNGMTPITSSRASL